MSDSDVNTSSLPPPPPPLPHPSSSQPDESKRRKSPFEGKIQLPIRRPSNNSGRSHGSIGSGRSLAISHPSNNTSPVLLTRSNQWNPASESSTPPITDTFEPIFGARRRKWKCWVLTGMTITGLILAAMFGFYLAGQRQIFLRHIHEHRHRYEQNSTVTDTNTTSTRDLESSMDSVATNESPTTTNSEGMPGSNDGLSPSAPKNDLSITEIPKSSKLPSANSQGDLWKAMVEGDHEAVTQLKRQSPVGHAEEDMAQSAIDGEPTSDTHPSEEVESEEEDENIEETQPTQVEPAKGYATSVETVPVHPVQQLPDVHPETPLEDDMHEAAEEPELSKETAASHETPIGIPESITPVDEKPPPSDLSGSAEDVPSESTELAEHAIGLPPSEIPGSETTLEDIMPEPAIGVPESIIPVDESPPLSDLSGSAEDVPSEIPGSETPLEDITPEPAEEPELSEETAASHETPIGIPESITPVDESPPLSDLSGSAEDVPSEIPGSETPLEDIMPEPAEEPELSEETAASHETPIGVPESITPVDESPHPSDLSGSAEDVPSESTEVEEHSIGLPPSEIPGSETPLEDITPEPAEEPELSQETAASHETPIGVPESIIPVDESPPLSDLSGSAEDVRSAIPGSETPLEDIMPEPAEEPELSEETAASHETPIGVPESITPVDESPHPSDLSGSAEDVSSEITEVGEHFIGLPPSEISGYSEDVELEPVDESVLPYKNPIVMGPTVVKDTHHVPRTGGETIEDFELPEVSEVDDNLSPVEHETEILESPQDDTGVGFVAEPGSLEKEQLSKIADFVDEQPNPGEIYPSLDDVGPKTREEAQRVDSPSQDTMEVPAVHDFPIEEMPLKSEEILLQEPHLSEISPPVEYPTGLNPTEPGLPPALDESKGEPVPLTEAYGPQDSLSNEFLDWQVGPAEDVSAPFLEAPTDDFGEAYHPESLPQPVDETNEFSRNVQEQYVKTMPGGVQLIEGIEQPDVSQDYAFDEVGHPIDGIGLEPYPSQGSPIDEVQTRSEPIQEDASEEASKSEYAKYLPAQVVEYPIENTPKYSVESDEGNVGLQPGLSGGMPEWPVEVEELGSTIDHNPQSLDINADEAQYTPVETSKASLVYTLEPAQPDVVEDYPIGDDKPPIAGIGDHLSPFQEIPIEETEMPPYGSIEEYPLEEENEIPTYKEGYSNNLLEQMEEYPVDNVPEHQIQLDQHFAGFDPELPVEMPEWPVGVEAQEFEQNPELLNIIAHEAQYKPMKTSEENLVYFLEPAQPNVVQYYSFGDDEHPNEGTGNNLSPFQESPIEEMPRFGPIEEYPLEEENEIPSNEERYAENLHEQVDAYPGRNTPEHSIEPDQLYAGFAPVLLQKFPAGVEVPEYSIEENPESLNGPAYATEYIPIKNPGNSPMYSLQPAPDMVQSYPGEEISFHPAGLESSYLTGELYGPSEVSEEPFQVPSDLKTPPSTPNLVYETDAMGSFPVKGPLESSQTPVSGFSSEQFGDNIATSKNGQEGLVQSSNIDNPISNQDFVKESGSYYPGEVDAEEFKLPSRNENYLPSDFVPYIEASHFPEGPLPVDDSQEFNAGLPASGEIFVEGPGVEDNLEKAVPFVRGSSNHNEGILVLEEGTPLKQTGQPAKLGGDFDGSLDEDEELIRADQRRSASYNDPFELVDGASSVAEKVPLSSFPSRLLSKLSVREGPPVFLPHGALPDEIPTIGSTSLVIPEGTIATPALILETLPKDLQKPLHNQDMLTSVSQILNQMNVAPIQSSSHKTNQKPSVFPTLYPSSQQRSPLDHITDLLPGSPNLQLIPNFSSSKDSLRQMQHHLSPFPIRTSDSPLHHLPHLIPSVPQPWPNNLFAHYQPSHQLLKSVLTNQLVPPPENPEPLPTHQRSPQPVAIPHQQMPLPRLTPYPLPTPHQTPQAPLHSPLDHHAHQVPQLPPPHNLFHPPQAQNVANPLQTHHRVSTSPFETSPTAFSQEFSSPVPTTQLIPRPNPVFPITESFAPAFHGERVANIQPLNPSLYKPLPTAARRELAQPTHLNNHNLYKPLSQTPPRELASLNHRPNPTLHKSRPVASRRNLASHIYRDNPNLYNQLSQYSPREQAATDLPQSHIPHTSVAPASPRSVAHPTHPRSPILHERLSQAPRRKLTTPNHRERHFLVSQSPTVAVRQPFANQGHPPVHSNWPTYLYRNMTPSPNKGQTGPTPQQPNPNFENVSKPIIHPISQLKHGAFETAIPSRPIPPPNHLPERSQSTQPFFGRAQVPIKQNLQKPRPSEVAQLPSSKAPVNNVAKTPPKSYKLVHASDKHPDTQKGLVPMAENQQAYRPQVKVPVPSPNLYSTPKFSKPVPDAITAQQNSPTANFFTHLTNTTEDGRPGTQKSVTNAPVTAYRRQKTPSEYGPLRQLVLPHYTKDIFNMSPTPTVNSLTRGLLNKYPVSYVSREKVDRSHVLQNTSPSQVERETSPRAPVYIPETLHVHSAYPHRNSSLNLHPNSSNRTPPLIAHASKHLPSPKHTQISKASPKEAINLPQPNSIGKSLSLQNVAPTQKAIHKKVVGPLQPELVENSLLPQGTAPIPKKVLNNILSLHKSKIVGNSPSPSVPGQIPNAVPTKFISSSQKTSAHPPPIQASRTLKNSAPMKVATDPPKAPKTLSKSVPFQANQSPVKEKTPIVAQKLYPHVPVKYLSQPFTVPYSENYEVKPLAIEEPDLPLPLSAPSQYIPLFINKPQNISKIFKNSIPVLANSPSNPTYSVPNFVDHLKSVAPPVKNVAKPVHLVKKAGPLSVEHSKSKVVEKPHVFAHPFYEVPKATSVGLPPVEVISNPNARNLQFEQKHKIPQGLEASQHVGFIQKPSETALQTPPSGEYVKAPYTWTDIDPRLLAPSLPIPLAILQRQQNFPVQVSPSLVALPNTPQVLPSFLRRIPYSWLRPVLKVANQNQWPGAHVL